MNIRVDLYNKITAQLNSLNFIEWIDLYKGQLDRPKESYPFGFPAAFISINTINYDAMTIDYIEANTTVDVLVFFNQFGDTFEGAEDQQTSLTILDQLDAITLALQWLKGDFFNELNVILEEDITEQYQRPAYKISFTTYIHKELNTDNYVYNT